MEKKKLLILLGIFMILGFEPKKILFRHSIGIVVRILKNVWQAI